MFINVVFFCYQDTYMYTTRTVYRVLGFFPVVRIGTPTTPPPAGECVPPLVPGRDTLACGRGSGGGGVPIPTRGQTLCYSRYVCTLCVYRRRSLGYGESFPLLVTFLVLRDEMRSWRLMIKYGVIPCPASNTYISNLICRGSHLSTPTSWFLLFVFQPFPPGRPSFRLPINWPLCIFKVVFMCTHGFSLSLINATGQHLKRWADLNSRVDRVPGFISSRPNWGRPLPYPKASVAPLLFSSVERTHSLAGEEVGGSNSDEGTNNVVLLWIIITLRSAICLKLSLDPFPLGLPNCMINPMKAYIANFFEKPNSFSTIAVQRHFTPKIGKNYSQKGNCAASVLITTFLYLWAIYVYIHCRSAYLAARENRRTDRGNT
jgi:hypothetical protein